jgi:uncharacterized protein (TIGR00730 family)
MKEHLKRYIDEGTSSHLRGIRVLLEFFYASDQFNHLKRARTPVVSVFGSARSKPNSKLYKKAYNIGRLLYDAKYAVLTGGSTGVMEAANQGVADAIVTELDKKKKYGTPDMIRHSEEYTRLLKKYSLGLRISLPVNETENPWLGTTATFHYFMIRKFYFASLSHAFMALEGGWGTRDELFEILTLVQTGKAPLMPIIYVSRDPTHIKVDMTHALKENYISRKDLHLIDFVQQPKRAVSIVTEFYKHFYRLDYMSKNTIRFFLHNPPSREFIRAIKDIWPKFQKGLVEYRLRNKSLYIIRKHGYSYGLIRQFINKLNQKV